MPFSHELPRLTDSRKTISDAYRVNETEMVTQLIKEAELDVRMLTQIEEKTKELVLHVRKEREKSTGLDSFLHQYSLSSEEGIALMCLAEALLRVPDKATIDELIQDKLSSPNWSENLNKDNSFFVNAATWGLMLTGSILEPTQQHEKNFKHSLKSWLGKTSKGVIRKAVAKAMQIMSKQFVMGETIGEAIKRAKSLEKIGYRYSYDMLGEAALTEEDAQFYLEEYEKAIEAIGEASKGKNIYESPGVSVKLSALYPRYEVSQYDRALDALAKRLCLLCQKAKANEVALTVDAEEADRLDLSLDIMEKVVMDPSLANWEGFGLALQSYQKRAFFVIDWIKGLSEKSGKRIMVRLIKGAYWDTEIKRAQMDGLSGYPVFTNKHFTDVSFQACAKKILTMTQHIYPQFATHNAYSVALILNLAGDYRDFEFQCLHGMGTELYGAITPPNALNIPCRIYAPCGTHEDLLPYLVRRLLENGANSSFVNRIADKALPIERLIESPIKKAKKQLDTINQQIPLPSAIFGEHRTNANGLDISDYNTINALAENLNTFAKKEWKATPLIYQNEPEGKNVAVFSPNDNTHCVGHVMVTQDEDINVALTHASRAFPHWSERTVHDRADCLNQLADLLEHHRKECYALLMWEAGKTLSDAIAEVREAIDFCRYYALEAKAKLAHPIYFEGYTGESNTLRYHGRGPILCISPWNFPLAIFLGQITASLVTGNTVIAKPAEQTPLIAYYAVKLCYEAGIPENVLQLLPGDGNVGAACVQDERIKGVLFTGSTQTARLINQSLANRQGEISPLIAETGGQNAMIVGSSALLEQVVNDVLVSSFGSAGQRCSALRVVYVQRDIVEKFKTMLKGAMAELKVGSTYHYETDVGPVIDKEAQSNLKKHIDSLIKKDQLLYQVPLSPSAAKGIFVQPTAFEINTITELTQEHFGPILHVVAYDKDEIDNVIEEINGTGFGLTFGVHSRIDNFSKTLCERVHAGNCYVNRNMTGAVVGLQPFGGQGLSGTGPKAGGPLYLFRLCHEKTITVDTTAAGGNASLMSGE